MSTLLAKNIKLLATFVDGQDDIENAAIFVRGPEILWVGRMTDLPADYRAADTKLDLSKCVVIPGEVPKPKWSCISCMNRNPNACMVRSEWRNRCHHTKLTEAYLCAFRPGQFSSPYVSGLLSAKLQLLVRMLLSCQVYVNMFSRSAQVAQAANMYTCGPAVTSVCCSD